MTEKERRSPLGAIVDETREFGRIVWRFAPLEAMSRERLPRAPCPRMSRATLPIPRSAHASITCV